MFAVLLLFVAPFTFDSALPRYMQNQCGIWPTSYYMTMKLSANLMYTPVY